MNFVRQILKTKGDKVWSIAPDETAYKALQLMSERNFGSLLVIDKKKVVGIFTERDYARKVILKGKSSKTTPVSDLMTKKVLFVDPGTSVEDCMALMIDKGVRHLPVMEKKKLIGIVTVGDVVKQHIVDQKYKIEELERYLHEKC